MIAQRKQKTIQYRVMETWYMALVKGLRKAVQELMRYPQNLRLKGAGRQSNPALKMKESWPARKPVRRRFHVLFSSSSITTFLNLLYTVKWSKVLFHSWASWFLRRNLAVFIILTLGVIERIECLVALSVLVTQGGIDWAFWYSGKFIIIWVWVCLI